MTRSEIEFLFAAEPPDLSVFQDAQKFGLKLQWHLADFIQEEGSTIGQFEASRANADGAGERAFLVAKYFAFDQCFGNRRRVHGNERSVRSLAQTMNRACREFLAGAAFAGDERRGIAGAEADDEVVDFTHGLLVPMNSPKPDPRSSWELSFLVVCRV